MASTTTPEVADYEYDDEYIVPMIPAVQIPSAIGLILLIAIGISGNAMTVAAYISDKRLNSVYDFYIFNLGITDLLLCCISMPFYAVYTLMEFTWPFGYGFCKVWLFIDFTLCFQSILIMLIISLDRLLMITMGPMYTRVTKKIGGIQIAVAWVVSSLVYGPAIIGWNHWVGYSTVEHNDCDVEFAYDHTFTTITSIVEFVLPFVCLTLLNTLVYLKIRQRMCVSPEKKHGQQQQQPEMRPHATTTNHNHSNAYVVETANSNTLTNSNGTTNNVGQLNGSIFKSKDNATTQKQAKAAKFLAMLVVAFLVFWAPYTVTTMVISFCDECVNTSLYESFNWLLWMKSAVNPFLYAYNCPRYRCHFRKYISCNGWLPIFKSETSSGATRPSDTSV